MKANPASSSAFRFDAESIPASATTTMSRTPWRCANALSTGIRVVVSAALPLEQVDLEREPARVHQEPDLDLRIDPVLLAHPDLAQLVLVAALEVQRRHVIEHQRGGPPAGRVRPGGRSQLPAVIAGLRAGKGPEQRAQAHRRRADLV